MIGHQKAFGLAGLLLICACGSVTQKAGSVTTPAATPAAVQASAVPQTIIAEGVLVGQLASPPTVIVTKRDGSVLAKVPGTGLPDQHAVGAYVVVDGATGKAQSVDANGVVKDVAPAAAKLFASFPYSPPLVVDSTTAIVGCVTSDLGCSAQRVDLRTGLATTLLTVPMLTGQAAMRGAPLTTLDISPDGGTVWLERASLTAGEFRLDIVGVDLTTGSIASHELPNALDDPDLAISRDGKSVAAQEDAGTNSSNLAIGHLHLFSVATHADADVQGTAPYVRGWPPPGPATVLFSADGSSVAWWGGFNNGDLDNRINLSTIAGPGRQLFRAVDHSVTDVPITAVFWLNANTLVVNQQGQLLTVTTNGDVTSLHVGWDDPASGPRDATQLAAVLQPS